MITIAGHHCYLQYRQNFNILMINDQSCHNHDANYSDGYDNEPEVDDYKDDGYDNEPDGDDYKDDGYDNEPDVDDYKDDGYDNEPDVDDYT